MMDWKYIESNHEILAPLSPLAGKIIVDVGCGEGALVHELLSYSALAKGVDIPDMVKKARQRSPQTAIGDQLFLEGSGEQLPLGDDYADAVIYSSSFHHIFPDRMEDALRETRRVLKPGGLALFIEPVSEPGAYSELAALLKDETEIQRQAYETLIKARESGFKWIHEAHYYMLRSLDYYRRQVRSFCDDPEKVRECIQKAESITLSHCRLLGSAPEDFLYKSFIRAILLQRG